VKYAILLLLTLGLCACPGESSQTGDGANSGDHGADGETSTPSGPRQFTKPEIDSMVAAIDGPTTARGEVALAALPSHPKYFEDHPELLTTVRDALLGVLEGETDEHNRAIAIGKLMSMGEHAASTMPKLIERLDHPIDGQFVTHNLPLMGEAGLTALPRMIELLEAGAERKHVHIIDGLERLGPAAASAVPVLTKIVKENGNGVLRVKAANALGAIGNAASSALDALDEMAKTGGDTLRFAAKTAAEKIRNG
jgi:hypothetical protein